jgi:hypothetical protein
MIVKIDRLKILAAANSLANELGKSDILWKYFGLSYVQTPHKEFLVCKVLDKDLLTWSMIKYGFEVEQYNPNRKY